MSQNITENHTAGAVARLRRLQFEQTPNERRELEVLPRLLEGCDQFIDVGANVGLYLFHANRILHNGKIFAIEANPALRPVLQEVFEHARADADNGNRFTLETCAILDKPGVIDFFVTPNMDDSSIFSKRIQGATKQSVATRPLDDLYEPSRKTLIKMDIEGAEYRALKSATRFLKCGHAEFFLELHPWGDKDIGKYPLQVCNLFFASGYCCKRVYNHYHFVRAGIIYRTFMYLAVLPHFTLMWLGNRYPNGFGQGVKWLHGLLSRVRHTVLSPR
jgi:FkbM family methyltransferase